jgi:hypothetical protein
MATPPVRPLRGRPALIVPRRRPAECRQKTALLEAATDEKRRALRPAVARSPGPDTDGDAGTW